MSVFVTVGTTSFDALICTCMETSFLKLLVTKGYEKLILQIGRGEYVPQRSPVEEIDVSFFRFKESLQDDMARANLIISHGGAGSIMESLELKKPLVVVINDQLMHNHQMELAKQLQDDNHLLFTTCSHLLNTVEHMDVSSLKPYTRGNPRVFGDYLDSVMGFR
ncbi:hypothetical protein EMCRGX_G030583 [Ephydatia muelleri]